MKHFVNTALKEFLSQVPHLVEGRLQIVEREIPLKPCKFDVCQSVGCEIFQMLKLDVFRLIKLDLFKLIKLDVLKLIKLDVFKLIKLDVLG